VNNNGILPANITLTAPSFVSFVDISSLEIITPNYVLSGSSSNNIEVQVKTHEIPDSMITVVSDDEKYVDFSITIYWKQYWTQLSGGSVDINDGKPVIIPVRTRLRSGTLVITPDSLFLEIQTELVAKRSLTIYNVLATNQSWSVSEIQYSNREK